MLTSYLQSEIFFPQKNGWSWCASFSSISFENRRWTSLTTYPISSRRNSAHGYKSGWPDTAVKSRPQHHKTVRGAVSEPYKYDPFCSARIRPSERALLYKGPKQKTRDNGGPDGGSCTDCGSAYWECNGECSRSGFWVNQFWSTNKQEKLIRQIFNWKCPTFLTY